MKLKRKRAGQRAARNVEPNTPGTLDSHDWTLRLYVAGQTPKSLIAFANLKRFCETHLSGRYQIEVIDLARSPQLAQRDQIVALPTLVRKVPEPIRRIIGDLSDPDRMFLGMDLDSRDGPGRRPEL